MIKIWAKVGESIDLGGHDVTVAAIEAGSVHLTATRSPYRIVVGMGETLRLCLPNGNTVIVQLVERKRNDSVRLKFEVPESIRPIKKTKE